MKVKNLITLICFLGLILTSYLTYSHYFGSRICNINSLISCNEVITSEYSEIFKIPISILGITYFILVLIVVMYFDYDLKYISYLSLLVLIYSLYLTYIEIFIIKAICLGCEATKVLILAIIIILFYFKNKKLS